MPTDSFIKQAQEGAVLRVLAVARSSATEVVDILEDHCKIKVKAPPVDGKANAALCQYLAKLFKLPKARVVLLRGQSSKQKAFLLSGLSAPSAAAILNNVLRKRQ